MLLRTGDQAVLVLTDKVIAPSTSKNALSGQINTATYSYPSLHHHGEHQDYPHHFGHHCEPK